MLYFTRCTYFCRQDDFSLITPETSVASRDPSIIVQTADLNKGSDALSIINLYINVRGGGVGGERVSF